MGGTPPPPPEDETNGTTTEIAFLHKNTAYFGIFVLSIFLTNDADGGTPTSHLKVKNRRWDFSILSLIGPAGNGHKDPSLQKKEHPHPHHPNLEEKNNAKVGVVCISLWNGPGVSGWGGWSRTFHW